MITSKIEELAGMKILPKIKRQLNKVLWNAGIQVVRNDETVDFYLHKYESYEEYKKTQIEHNIRKQSSVWADEKTLRHMSETLRALLKVETGLLAGLCHGARNGFEQAFLSDESGFDAIGTDISPTAENYPRSVHWDFHDENPDWVNRFDFVYSNSLDQSWNPRRALGTWLNQVKKGGYVIIEHSDSHGPRGASAMDPFGVKPTVMPYVLAGWFGTDISICISEAKKDYKNRKVWFFYLKKNTDFVSVVDS